MKYFIFLILNITILSTYRRNLSEMLNIKIFISLIIVLEILLLLSLVFIQLLALLPDKDVYLLCINYSFECYQLFFRQHCLCIVINVICVSIGAKFSAGLRSVEKFSCIIL